MAITREFPWQYQGICFGKTRDFYLTEYTRKAIETQTGVPVITSKNAAQLSEVVTNLLEDAADMDK